MKIHSRNSIKRQFPKQGLELINHFGQDSWIQQCSVRRSPLDDFVILARLLAVCSHLLLPLGCRVETSTELALSSLGFAPKRTLVSGCILQVLYHHKLTFFFLVVE